MNFKILETEQKLRGGYYTPEILADFINRWVLESNPKQILEPSCGDGVFFESFFNTFRDSIMLTAFEINESESRKAEQRFYQNNYNNFKIFNKDFLKWTVQNFNTDAKFDAVVGNPPFIRYQYLEDDTQSLIEMIFKLLRLKFTKHTNLWVPFVLASIHFLKPQGRLGMVLPAEILHVMHAQSLRTYLGQNCERLLIFDPEDLWFTDTLQGAVVLFAEKKKEIESETKGLSIIKTKGYKFTEESPSKYISSAKYINGKTIEGKWTYALLTDVEYDLLLSLRRNKYIHQFKNIADVDVGIVTGANKYFLVNDEVIKKFDLEKYSHPMFGRSEHCQGVIYDEIQHQKNISNGAPTNFIWFDIDSEEELNLLQKDYLKVGKAESIHLRYKCRIRNPWFRVPSVYTTKIGMLKRAHEFPKLILNDIQAYTTDTSYRIKSKYLDESSIVYSFINSLTALTAELEGRHYGGGVLELVPSEIEKLLIPIPQNLNFVSGLKKLNEEFTHKINAQEILGKQDQIILSAIGLSKEEIRVIQSARKRLSARRRRI
ncbi:MAG: restriction endonuclease [Melioribacteraceae bacterium]|nr:MAG: restriction endonuclease [Melioribacteraceae bacterium]